MVQTSPKLLLIAALALGQAGCSALSLGTKIEKPIHADYSIESAAFRDSMGNLLNAPLVEGNEVVELLNGDRIFTSMLDAIKGARKTITFETFIWSSGVVGTMFVDALCERAEAGVKVHVMVDAVGSNKLKGKDIKKMEAAGVKFKKYNSPLSFKVFHANHRTHRKIMVVDGVVGFTGGVCFNDDWRGDAQPKRWRDTHFRVVGPVVGQLQASFADNWLQMMSEVLHGPDYFPHIKPEGDMTAQAFVSGPHGGAQGARLAYLLSFAAARKSIRISHAYFVPDKLVIKALCDARKRGVKVEVIFPNKIDNKAVKKAGWSRLRPLLEAGVEFHEYQKTLYHCKIVVVDDVWSMVGSVNFDDRSLRINDEANMNVLHRGFAAQLIESFEADKRESKRLTLEEFKTRNPLSKFFDHSAGALGSQL